MSGLSLLAEVEPVSHDRQPGPRYICRLCDLEASLPNMVNHLIGRRHRQNYLVRRGFTGITWICVSCMILLLDVLLKLSKDHGGQDLKYSDDWCTFLFLGYEKERLGDMGQYQCPGSIREGFTSLGGDCGKTEWERKSKGKSFIF